MNINQILEHQRKFFRSSVILPVKFCVEMLKKLYHTIKKYEAEIGEAVKVDSPIACFIYFHCKTLLQLQRKLRYFPILTSVGYRILMKLQNSDICSIFP